MALDATAVARMIRAFVKLIHNVPVGKDWTPNQQLAAITNYRNAMTRRPLYDQTDDATTQENYPISVNTDFFIPNDGTGKAGVEMLDPENAQLQNIADIEHFTDRLIAATTVPKRYFPFANSTAKLSEGGGTAEDKHFAATLMMCQMMLKVGYEKVFRLELAAHGIDPESVRFDWTMAAVNTTDIFRVSQTMLNNIKSLQILLQLYPEFRMQSSTILKEYTTLSDNAKSVLGKIELDKEYKPQGPGAVSPRTTLPALGAGPEGRTQI